MFAKLLATEDRFIASRTCNAGNDPSYRTLWVSEDGHDWTATQPDTNMDIRDLISVRSGFVAVGSTRSDLQSAAWFSTDGVTWTPLSLDLAEPALGPIREITVGGPGLVAFGKDFSTDELFLWVAALAPGT